MKCPATLAASKVIIIAIIPHSKIFPADVEKPAWKSLKTQHFLEEDIRLLTSPKPTGLDSKVYSGTTLDQFLDDAPSARWLYIIDLEQDTFLVSMPRYWTRVFCLQNLPRSLFESAVSLSPGAGHCVEDDYRVFLNPVARIHLAPSDRPAEPDPVLITEYRSRAVELLPCRSFPGVETFPVRKNLRLVLLRQFYRTHVSQFCHVNQSRDATSVGNLSEFIFTIVNLARSTVEFRLQRDRNDSTPAESNRNRSVTRCLYDDLPTTSEYWMDGILVVLEPDISTAENLHAAIGKALLQTGTRGRRPTSTPSAIICSLSAIVLVYIRGTAVSHTANLNFFPQYLCCIDDTIDSTGVLALLDTFYRPPQLAAPQSFPAPFKHLPTEICQQIFYHACPATRTALESSCRLFRGIAHDHGVRIGECYFQARLPENSDPAFVGEIYGTENNVVYGADKGVWGKRAARAVYTRRTVVYLAVGPRAVGPVYWPVLVMPNAEVVRLDLRPLEAKERRATMPGMPWWSFMVVRGM